MKKKILLTGIDGQVGGELKHTLLPLGNVHAFNRQTLNLQNPDQIKDVIRTLKPDIIVNPAAYTAVDKAEGNEGTATTVNATGPKILAEEAKRIGAFLVHYSTDYVFDGAAINPYREEDLPNPLNVYGKTKLEGEKFIQGTGVNHLIFRASWVYGLKGKNFLLTMLRLAKEKPSLNIVSDQFGAPTWCASIAESTANILKQCIHNNNYDEISGLYHMTSSGVTSWHGFAHEIFRLQKEFNPNFKAPNLGKITTSEYPLPAKRPQYSVLSSLKLNQAFNVVMPDWKDALRLCFKSAIITA